jgi:hypothetical protein
MMDLDTADIAELGWEDAKFFGFKWENHGKDLRLFFQHASRPIAGLVCHWASDLRVDLTWLRPKNSSEENPIRRAGPLLIGDVGFTQSAEGRWRIVLDFWRYGRLECECQSVTTIEAENIV